MKANYKPGDSITEQGAVVTCEFHFGSAREMRKFLQHVDMSHCQMIYARSTTVRLCDDPSYNPMKFFVDR